MTSEYPTSEPDTSVTDDEQEFLDDGDVLYEEQVEPEYGILGFTLRELLIVGAWLVAFVVSFFPIYSGATPSLWGQGIQWILPIGLPTVATFLIVLRRFSPDGIRRVGSLGIDQFASVAFSVSALFWAQLSWEIVAQSIAVGQVVPFWVNWVQLVVMLALVVLTVFAPLVPGLREDFQGRLETLAHRNANPVRPVIARPRPEPVAQAEPQTTASASAEQAPSADEPREPGPITALLDLELSRENATDEVARLDAPEQVPLSAHASGGDTGTEDVTDQQEYVPGYLRRSRGDDDMPSVDVPVAEVTDDSPFAPAAPAVAPTAQPFWALAPSTRDVLDEHGDPLFQVGPEAWALVIEDRGGAFVVRHDDGRIGFLHDIADITKG
ncbi:MAG: hypothetical protein ACQEW8_03560 [Actinomycetota bacterium]